MEYQFPLGYDPSCSRFKMIFVGLLFPLEPLNPCPSLIWHPNGCDKSMSHTNNKLV